MSQIDWGYVGAAKLSTRGQLVLPELVRLMLGLKTGSAFKVELSRDGDTCAPQIILTPLEKSGRVIDPNGQMQTVDREEEEHVVDGPAPV